MAILNFSDVLKKVGLDPKEVKLIRHALSDKRFRISLMKYLGQFTRNYTQTTKRGLLTTNKG